VILLGDDLNTVYFKEKLTKTFPYVIGIENSFEKKLLKSIFTEIATNNYKVIGESKNTSPSPSPVAATPPPPPSRPAPLPPAPRPVAATPPPPPSRPAPPPPAPRPVATTPPPPPSRPAPPPTPPKAPPPVPPKPPVPLIQTNNKSENKKDIDSQLTKKLDNFYKTLIAVNSQTTSKIFIRPRINVNKFTKLKNKIGIHENVSDCLLQYDNTVFGSGDDGFFATIYIFGWHNIFEEGKYLKWTDIDSFSTSGDNAINVLEKSGINHSVYTNLVKQPKEIANGLNELLKILS
jgi:hypothetical protein